MKLISTLLFLFAVEAFASNYISSTHSGLQLANEHGLARLTAWSPENKLDFSGYGQIKMKDLCLHSRGMGLATWRPCIEGSKAQIWSLKEEVLKTEEGYCAETESYSNSVLNPRVVVKTCREKVEQKWKAHE